MPERPPDEAYWVRPWSSILFTGDVFEAIPFATKATELLTRESGGQPVQHFQGEVAFAYGMLISPTCDIYESIVPDPVTAHKFRVLVPILALEHVVAETKTVERNVGLLRANDRLTAYMYLPQLAKLFPESLACLYRPTTVSDDFLADPPKRVVQMHPEARRQLKIKLATYWGRGRPQREDFKLYEKDEDKVQSKAWPRSKYDTGQEIL